MLSIPPAFILSQNQTLKFNCLKSSLLLQSNNGSNFVISLLTCFKVPKHFSCSSYLKKLTEITFLFALCQIKSHFFLIPFLICIYPVYRPGLPSSGEPFRTQLVYYIIQPHTLSSKLSNFFQKYFNFFKFFAFRSSPRDSLSNIPSFLIDVNRLKTLF